MIFLKSYSHQANLQLKHEIMPARIGKFFIAALLWRPATFHSERVSSISSGAVCLPSHMACCRRKWSYNENIKLMRCFYLYKRDETGYCDRLKYVPNPSRSSICVNTLCCHAQNIQVSLLLTEYELVNFQAACCDFDVDT